MRIAWDSGRPLLEQYSPHEALRGVERAEQTLASCWQKQVSQHLPQSRGSSSLFRGLHFHPNNRQERIVLFKFSLSCSFDLLIRFICSFQWQCSKWFAFVDYNSIIIMTWWLHIFQTINALFTVDRDWMIQPLMVNAFHNPTANEISRYQLTAYKAI